MGSMDKNSTRHGAVTVNEVGDSDGLAANMPCAKFPVLWYIFVGNKTFTKEAGKVEIKENSVCPKCGSAIKIGLLKKGFRVKCSKCPFKIYPFHGEISQGILSVYLKPYLEKGQAVSDQLAGRYPSVAAQLKAWRKKRGEG